MQKKSLKVIFIFINIILNYSNILRALFSTTIEGSDYLIWSGFYKLK